MHIWAKDEHSYLGKMEEKYGVLGFFQKLYNLNFLRLILNKSFVVIPIGNPVFKKNFVFEVWPKMLFEMISKTLISQKIINPNWTREKRVYLVDFPAINLMCFRYDPEIF